MSVGVSGEFYFRDFGMPSRKADQSKGLLDADGEVGTGSESLGLSQNPAGTHAQCYLGLF